MQCVSQGRICSDKFMCCHTEIAFAAHHISVSQRILTPGQLDLLDCECYTKVCRAVGKDDTEFRGWNKNKTKNQNKTKIP